MAVLKFLKIESLADFFSRVFLHGEMVASPKGNRASAWTNLRVLWQIYNIFSVTYTVWMILVPKERTCSKLHDDYKNIYNFMVFITNNEGKRSVLELRANPVLI